MKLPVSHPESVAIFYRSDVSYGGDINEQEAPMFEHLGLGGAGELPAPAFEFMQDGICTTLAAMSILMNEEDVAMVCIHAHRYERVPLVAGIEANMVRRVQAAMGWDMSHETGWDPDHDRVEAIVDSHTKQLLCYHFFIQGDGCEVFFLA